MLLTNNNCVDYDFFGNWERLIFHLLYAFHGERIVSELFMLSMKNNGLLTKISQNTLAPLKENFEQDVLFESARVIFL